MLNVVILSVAFIVMLNVVMLNVVMLSVAFFIVMLSVVILNVGIVKRTSLLRNGVSYLVKKIYNTGPEIPSWTCAIKHLQ